MINKFILSSLMLSACLSTAFSMEKYSLSRPEDEKLLGQYRLTQGRNLQSPQEVMDYLEQLKQAFRESKFSRILELAYPQPNIEFEQSLNEAELYSFTRVQAICAAYSGLVEATLDSSKKIIYYTEILKEHQAYMDAFSEVTSDSRPFLQNLLIHRHFIYRKSGLAHAKIAEFKAESKYTPEQTREFVENHESAAHALEEALKYGGEILKYEAKNPRGIELRRILFLELLEDQLFLVNTYCSLAQVVPEVKREAYLKRAQELCLDFKTRKQGKFHQIALNALAILKSSLELKRLSNLPAAPKRVEAKRDQTRANAEHRLVNMVLNLKLKDEPIRIKVCHMQQKLNAFMKGQEAGWPEKVVQGLFEIENEIRTALLKDAGTPSLFVSLETIYENLGLVVGGVTLIDTFWKYMEAFVLTENFEDGIERTDILKAREMKQRKTISYKSRFISAALKNLKGDHAEWLEFEKELAEKDAEKKQKTKAKKERAHQRKVAAIQAELAESKVKEESQATPPTPKVEKPFPSPSADVPKPPIFDTPSLEIRDPIDEKQRKLERQQRHEEAEAKRNQEKEEETTTTAPSLSPTLPVEQPLSREELRERILSSSSETLAELYALSSRPLEVDLEIENNTWKFTRAEFEAYLTAMGCECKSGKGIHTKADLPKATLVTVGDEIITILNDFGGALTLPLWDKDYVPNYLKRQILEARKNLRALKITQLRAQGEWIYLKG